MAFRYYIKPQGQRYWVVRASGGAYYDHFVKGSLIALSHLDPLRIKPSHDSFFHPDFNALESGMKEFYEAKKFPKARFRSHYNQAKSFISEMNVGDLVLTIGYRSVTIGRIISDAFIDPTPVEIIYDIEKDRRVSLFSHLKRKVAWGPTLKRESLPHVMTGSFKANQAVFNIDEHWEALHHILYPIFFDNGVMYISANITQQESISNYSVSQFMAVLSELEVVSKEWDQLLDNEAKFDPIFLNYAMNAALQLSVKADFMSPGSLWGALPPITGLDAKTKKGIIVFMVGYSALFGSEKLGWEGIIDKDTKHKVYDFIEKRLKEGNRKDSIQQLNLKYPDMNTDVLESPSLDNSYKLPSRSDQG